MLRLTRMRSVAAVSRPLLSHVGARFVTKNAMEHPNPNIKSASDQLWYQFHNFWPVQVPLSMQMPGTPRAEDGVEAAEPVTELTTLPNGVRVITESSWGLGASMAIFLGTGSRVETKETHGCSHFLQHLAFKASVDKSHFMMTRDIESLGGHVAAGAGRDCIMYAGECLSSDAPELFELMAESALKPRLDKLDVDNARALVFGDHQNQMQNGAGAVQELLHAVAYQGQTLGASVMCDPHAAEMMQGATIQQFLDETISPSRVIVVGVGVEHARMLDTVQKVFGEMPSSSPKEPELAEYYGGDMRMQGEPGLAHIAIALEGVACDDKDMLALATLQSILGGGDQFSAGGPGKGLTSRIFRNVLSNPEVQTANGINVSYKDSGLFGIQATCDSQYADKTVKLLTTELARLRKPFTEEEVSRAKNMTRSSLFLNLETKGIVCEDLGRQVLFFGKRRSGKDIADGINALTADDLSRAAHRVLDTVPSVAAYGDTGYVPPYEEIAAALAK